MFWTVSKLIKCTSCSQWNNYELLIPRRDGGAEKELKTERQIDEGRNLL